MCIYFRDNSKKLIARGVGYLRKGKVTKSGNLWLNESNSINHLPSCVESNGSLEAVSTRERNSEHQDTMPEWVTSFSLGNQSDVALTAIACCHIYVGSIGCKFSRSVLGGMPPGQGDFFVNFPAP